MRSFVFLLVLVFTSSAVGLLHTTSYAQQIIPEDESSLQFTGESLPGPFSVGKDITSADIDAALSFDERQRLSPDLQRMLTAQRLHPGWQIAAKAEDHPSIAKSADDEALIHIIVYSDSPSALNVPGLTVQSTFSDFATARIAESRLTDLAASADVAFAKPAESHELDHVESIADTRAHLLHQGVIDNTAYLGMGAAVCIVDTGIDFTHEDFIDEYGESRILSLWDQRINPESGESPPPGFSDGVEYSQEDLNDDIRRRGQRRVRHRDDNGHGTHVAGSAAGNGRTMDGTFRGMAPLADLIVVNVTEEGGSGTATTNLIEGVEYCIQTAEQHDLPVAANVSFGNTRGPKDGTEPFSRAIDELTGDQPGRVVSVSAGNAGNNNMHVQTTVEPGGSGTVEFDMPDTSVDGESGNWIRLDGWHSTGSDVSVELVSPPVYDSNGDGSPDSSFVLELDPGDVEERALPEIGTVEIAHYVPGSMGGGDLNTDLRLRPISTRAPAPGRWQLHVHNHSHEQVTYHGWLRTRGDLSDAELVNGDNWYTINRNAAGNHSLTVGNYTVRNSWFSTNGNHYRFRSMESGTVSPSSSRGPLRDGRMGLDFVAPGSAIASALSRDVTTSTRSATRMLPGRKYLILTGTSMSAPHAAGAAALLFAEDPSLSANDIKQLLNQNTRQDDAVADERIGGHGKMDVYAAMLAMRQTEPGAITRLGYAQSVSTTTRIDNRPHAVRFSPEADGAVTNLYLQTNREQDHRPAIDGEGDLLYLLYSDDNGMPAEPITDTLRTPLSRLVPQARISFDMWQAIHTDLEVKANESYHLVFFTEEDDASVRVSVGPPVEQPRSSVATDNTASSWRSLQDDINSDTPLELDLMAEVIQPTEHTTLPVKLLSFEAFQSERTVQLSWQTGSEQNNHGFRIRHSFEGEPFNEKAFVDGQGTTDTEQSYTYETDALDIGLHRFRLRQVNLDGTFIDSREIKIRVDIDGTHLIAAPYPNPSDHHAQFDVSVSDNQHVRARIIDMLGREIDVVIDEELEADTTHFFYLDTYRLASGQYVLYIEGETFSDQEVFTVIR